MRSYVTGRREPPCEPGPGAEGGAWELEGRQGTLRDPDPAVLTRTGFRRRGTASRFGLPGAQKKSGVDGLETNAAASRSRSAGEASSRRPATRRAGTSPPA